MGKGIPAINNIATKGLISALLVGSIGAKTVAMTKNEVNSDTRQNTELVSKEGAAAIKSANMPSIMQTSVPIFGNTKLNAIFLKFAEDEKEKAQFKNLLNQMYKNQGTFLASAQIQHELDRQQLFLLLNCKGNQLISRGLNPSLGNRIQEFGEDFYKSVRPNEKKVRQWLNKDYSPAMMALLSFDHAPNAKEVVARIDKIAEERANFTSDDVSFYYAASEDFKRKKLNNRTDDRSMSDLIAFKMFTIDKIIFKKTLKNNGVFGPDSKFNKFVSLSSFYNDWMGTVQPK